jgi:UDPglucose 6-dehydrogenase
VPALLAEATDALNRRQVSRLAEVVLSYLPPGGTAGVLGLSYKPDTEVIEESQGVGLAQELLKAGARVVAYDPAAMENAKSVLAGNVMFARTAAECAAQADVLAITTPWQQFAELTADLFQHRSAKPTVLDCWRVIRSEAIHMAVNYLTLGRGSAGADAASETLVTEATAD